MRISLANGSKKFGVDVHSLPANVVIPREAGLLHFGVRSTYILGLQIGSILSRLNRRSFSNGGPQRSRLGFFVSNVRKDWFFDIYIQGSKKIQL
jgi:hypothetical protein